MHFRTLNTKKNRPFQPRIHVKSMSETSDFLAKLVIPAGVEPTACRLGVPKSVRLWNPSTPLEHLILLDF